MAGGYVDALIKELELRRQEITDPFTTLYIGGGTPSILPVTETVRLVNTLSEIVDLSNVEEFTIEVNPEDVTESLLDSYRRLGINRISMGVQSFDDNMLRSINRRHSATEALAAVHMLKTGGWNYSIDLMFGLPGQSMELWRSDVGTLMQLRPPHFSAYLLSYEPGTRLYAMLQSGKVDEASEELATMMQSCITQSARENGYCHYEISNYALPGFHSRHNSAYWTMTPYLGLGASAHSFDGALRRFNPSNLKLYGEQIAGGISPAQIEEETLDERFNDYLVTGLRTARGLSISDLRDHFPGAYTEELLRDATPLITNSRLILTPTHLLIPEHHWLQSDSIIRALLRI